MSTFNESPRHKASSKKKILDKIKELLNSAPFGFSDVQAAFKKGVLQLSGTVPNIAGKRHAEAVSRSVEGVIDVDNILDADTAIVARVTAALADDPQTELSNIDVASDRGIVTLIGKVDHGSIRQRAEEITSQQPNVIKVINDLKIEPDEDTPTLKPRPMGPIINKLP